MTTFTDGFTGTANPLGGVWSTPTGSPGATPGLQKGSGGGSGSTQGAYNTNGGDGNQHSTYVNSPTFVQDQTVTMTLAAFGSSDQPGMCVRMQSGVNSYYMALVIGGAVNLYKVVSGVNGSTLASATGLTIGQTDVFSMQVSTSGGNAVFTVKQNGTTLPALNFTDTTSVLTGGQPGLAYLANNNGHSTAIGSFSATDTALTTFTGSFLTLGIG